MIVVALTLVALYAAFMAWICWLTVLDDEAADFDEEHHSALCLSDRSSIHDAQSSPSGVSRTAGVVDRPVAGVHPVSPHREGRSSRRMT